MPVVSVPDTPAPADLEDGETVEASTGSGARTDPLRETLRSLAKRGFRRLLVDGRAVTLEEVDVASLGSPTTLEVVVDRVVVDGEAQARLTDSIETAYREGGGAAFAVELARSEAEPPVVHEFSERFECRRCHILYEDPQPRLFSFNNPFGACPTCHGFGNVIELDLDLVVPDKTKSIRGGAIEPWTKPHYRTELATLKRDAKRLGHRPRHALAGSHRRAAPCRRRRRWRRLRGHPRVLRVARAQEIQGARPRVPEPLSRLPDVPGLQRHAPAPGGARRARVGQDHRPRLGDDGQRGAAVLRHPLVERAGHGDCRQGAARDREAAALPRRRRPGLPHAGPAVIDAVGRGVAAHQPGDVAGLGAGRHAVRPGRAVHRPAPARQPASHRDPAAAARPGQHRARRRARRRHDRGRRLHRRSGPGGRRARRPRDLRGLARRADARHQVADGQVPARAN